MLFTQLNKYREREREEIVSTSQSSQQEQMPLRTKFVQRG